MGCWRARIAFVVLYYVQVGVAFVLVVAMHVFPKSFNMTQLHPSVTTFTLQLCGPMIVYYVILLCDQRFRRTISHGGDARLHMLPHQRSSFAHMPAAPAVGMSLFLVSSCQLGMITDMLTSMVAVEPVNADEIVVESLLGSGTFGVVVKVRLERQDGRDLPADQQQRFALKLQSFHKSLDQQAQSYNQTARTERQIYQRIWLEKDEETGALGHPFIVKLECASEWPEGRQLFFEGTREPVKSENGKTHFHFGLMMEYCPLGPLSSYMSNRMRRGVDNEAQRHVHWLRVARRICAEILLALDFLHNAKHVVYRDLKPDNVLIVNSADDPDIKLSDFGLSKVVSASSVAASTVGTPYFMAPELLHVFPTATSSPARLPWSIDIFSFGILFVLAYGCDLYEMSLSFGTVKWVPPLSMPTRNGRLKWMSIDRGVGQYGERPHPVLTEEIWKTALLRLDKEPQCPKQAVQMIRECTSLSASMRPSVARIRSSAIFGAQADLPTVDWSSLGRQSA